MICRTPKIACSSSSAGWRRWTPSLRRLDPDLRRFVSSYARRRPQLTLDVRVQLAAQMQQSLQRAAPDQFSQNGPLAVLDHLANLELSS